MSEAPNDRGMNIYKWPTLESCAAPGLYSCSTELPSAFFITVRLPINILKTSQGWIKSLGCERTFLASILLSLLESILSVTAPTQEPKHSPASLPALESASTGDQEGVSDGREFMIYSARAKHLRTCSIKFSLDSFVAFLPVLVKLTTVWRFDLGILKSW